MSLLTNLIPWQYRALAVIGLIAATYGTGYVKGLMHEKDKWDTETTKQQAIVQRVAIKQAEVTEKIVIQYRDRIKVVHEVGQTILKEVKVYVSQKDDTACPVPNSFVMLWNNANRGEVPGAPDRPDETTSDVKLSDIGAQHAIESESCRANTEQLIGLQNWVREQRLIKCK